MCPIYLCLPSLSPCHTPSTLLNNRSIAFRQLVVITAAILLVRFALNNVLRFLARWSSSPVQWDKSKLFYVMKEVCQDS